MHVHCKFDSLVPVSSLKPYPKNRNTHTPEQIKRLAQLLKYQGVRAPIVIAKPFDCIAKGHGTLEAIKLNKWPDAPIVYQEFESEEQLYAFVQSDNAIASWASLDLSAINLDLPDLGPDFDIDLLGIKDFVIEPLDKYGDEGQDDVPEPPKVPKTQLGELWTLGNHRLLVGDCTVKENVERLMGGEKADMVFTDPPYGISLDTDYTKMGDSALKHRKIEGDDKPYDPGPILGLFQYCEEMFLWGANYYCWELPRGNTSWIVWDKRSQGEERIGMMDDMFGSDFELCWSKTKHQNKTARVLKPTGMYSINTDERNVHPTQKPVALAEWFFDRWGKITKIIWDGYLGSGSTLIACEKTNRRCFGMEIDPVYCDVILDRFAKYTGKDPKREDGQSWQDLKNS